MRKEFITKEAKFIYSKNELGYQEVLDGMKNAKKITIITYNISDKQIFLLNCIKSAPSDCEITIVTNIPNRWETYYYDNYREIAKKKINIYMTKLNPDNLGEKASVFFNFRNHGKIIMTETMAYVGSENYSEESKYNSEFGFICKDHDFIDFLTLEVLPDVENASVPYYEYDYMGLLLEANMIISNIFNLYNELHEQTYGLHDDIDGQWFYYLENDDLLEEKTLESINKALSTADEIAHDMYNAVDIITRGNEDELDKIYGIYEDLLKLSTLAENVSSSTEVDDLANFDFNDYINDLLQTDYAMVAYEENLENCIDCASDEASSVQYDLCTNAKGFIDILLDTITKYQNLFSQLLECFSQYEIKKINQAIDNT